MARIRRDECLVHDERCILKSGFEVADGPFVGRLAHRQAAFLIFCEVCFGPLKRRDIRRNNGWRTPGVGGGCGPRTQTLPSVLAFGPPGRRLTSGSTTNGSGSRSSRIFSMASAAVTSSTAATARIGSP